MSKKSLLSWFEKRRRSITLNLAQSLITKVIETVTELEKALQSLSQGIAKEAEKNIQRLFLTEVEIDNLRRSVFAELTKGTLPIKYREDLKAIISRLDRLADFVKDAARSIKIILEANYNVPHEFIDIFYRMAKTLVVCTNFVRKSIETLGVDPSQAIQLADKVDESENQIDNDHLRIKISFLKNPEKVAAPTFLVLYDLADAIEHAADMCADTADFIRVLAAGET
ncbi:MAG: DUF47 family protein [Candidatus Bathyarchaeota archaeon]|nr:MAG: DUF47 family protein [Candidatus Bathyarchaeota archaeon]